MRVQIPPWDGSILRDIRTFCRQLCKRTEVIEMPFGLRTCVGPRKHVLDGVQMRTLGVAILSGKGTSHCKI